MILQLSSNAFTFLNKSAVIDEVIPTNENPRFGAKVNEWVQMMMGKALNGVWQISVGAAGGIIVEILKQYYELRQ